MPDFKFSEEESLALTLFLKSQKNKENASLDFPKFKSGKGFFGKKNNLEKGKSYLEELTCLTCHKVGEEGNLLYTNLSEVNYRLNSDWVKEYLVAPYFFTGKKTLMPSLFYQMHSDSSQFEPIIENAIEKIEDITAYLFSLNKNKEKELQNQLDAFQKTKPNVTVELGEKIYIAQNCAGCHQGPKTNWEEKNAPDLSIEGERVQFDWLKDYLKKPVAIRPFGFQPGIGSRMPDFKLTDEEVELIVKFFEQQEMAATKFTPKKLSAFSMAKAETLFNDKLPCLGCHQLDEKGGKIGPDLDQVSERLKPSYVYQIIQNPHELIKGSVMPKIQMPQKNIELITNFLLQKKAEFISPPYLSLIQNPPYFNTSGSQEAKLYLKYCAACHGEEGQGNGYNSKYLATRPTNHTDEKYISLRPDDTLFDGIYAGGYILNKSHLMPPYGQTLDSEEIQNLVKYIRTLCDCQGPDWSLDN